ncbi:MAG: hypothetical protein AAFV29_26770, partial [Myxococcota bacterium]
MSDPAAVFRQGTPDVYPGGQFAASREGRRLVSMATGTLEAGAEAVSTDTIYDLASLTKPLATAILLGRA